MSVIELIKSVLPNDGLKIYLNEFPEGSEGLMIQESGTNGRVDSFYGYDGVIRSTITFYIRQKVKNNGYNDLLGVLKGFYKTVKNNKNLEVENIKLLYVDTFYVTNPTKDKFNNYNANLVFSIIYKESE